MIVSEQKAGASYESDFVGLTITKAEWKARFDFYWGSEYTLFLNQCQSSGGEQEHYYAAWYLEGAVAAWRATGDNAILDQLLFSIEEVIDTAAYVPIGDGSTYLGWAATKTSATEPKGYPLWESYFWRHVATLLRVMYQSPILRASGTYQTQYDTILSFIEKNVWEKWEVDSLGNFYRSRTHMASHWARIGMELYIITGDQKYKTVADNINFAGFPVTEDWPGANLRDRLYDFGGGYAWYQEWDTANKQDTDHGSDFMSFVVESETNGGYWTSADIAKFTTTFNSTIWYDDTPVAWKQYVDGTGTTDATISLHGWLNLGRNDEALQNRINTYYYPDPPGLGSYDSFASGIATLNTAYLEGTYVYPEKITIVRPWMLRMNGNPVRLQLGTNRIN